MIRNLHVLSKAPFLINLNKSHSRIEWANISFYRFFSLEDPHQLVTKLKSNWDELSVLGRVYVGKEGINAQLCVPETYLKSFAFNLEKISVFEGISKTFNISPTTTPNFSKLYIRVRKEIVATGVPLVEENTEDSHLDAEEWHEIMDNNPNCLIIDVRNSYETKIGYFEGAIKPDVATFKESIPVIEELIKQRAQGAPVLMYCTGGIRCERLLPYLKSKGLQNLFQLRGGITNYAKQVEAKGLKSRFRGKNFVFNEKLVEQVTDEVVSNCYYCGEKSDDVFNCRNQSCHRFIIQCKKCAEILQHTCSNECRDIVNLPPEEYRRYINTHPCIPLHERIKLPPSIPHHH